MKKKLDRTLGLYSAITISVGTMIGSAIFVLAGTSYDAAGPSASLSIFLAGLAALFTSFSFAELVTFIPTAGGGYAYVRDATDNGILGFITGWGFWLGYAMSCGLFALGFGTFLNYFFPVIPQLVGAYGLIIYVMFTNIKGVENSGKLQNIITTGLMILLVGYIIYGYFYLDLSNQEPFFPNGINGSFTAMGFLYITYIGYGLITTASEEVINPEKTIPRAIMISLIGVTVVKTAIFFTGSSIIHWEKLIPAYTNTPLIDTAVEMAGSMGGYLFALAGILATISSINTAMMASSRTSFAMSRDRVLPSIFKNINPKTKTPIFSILAATLIVFISTTIRNYENISTITSIFSLAGYSLVNVAVIVFRKKMPKATRKFKVPFYPLTPILGIIINILLVIQLIISNLFSFAIAFAILTMGIVYYYFILPQLKEAPKGMTPQPVPNLKFNAEKTERKQECYKVLVPIAYSETVSPLLKLSIDIVNPCQGKILPLHVVRVPEVIPIDSRYNNIREKMDRYEKLIGKIDDFSISAEYISEPLSIISRNIIYAIKGSADEEKANLILLGWHKSGLAYRMLGGIVHKALEEIPKTIGVFKQGNNKEVKKILYPYGGGIHSQASAEIVKRIAESNNAEVTFFRVIEEEISELEYKEIKEIMEKGLAGLNVKGDVEIIKESKMIEEVVKRSESHDLVILGASSEWGIKNHITGSKTDKIMEKIECSGLIIRETNLLMQRKKIRNFFNKIKNYFG
ncbi:MAG: amino acid permease [Bacillota bacterium]